MKKLDLNELLMPGQPLPQEDEMIRQALEILEYSPHGQQLVNFIKKEHIEIKIVATPQPVSYLPDSKLIYIGMNRNNPLSPCGFILMLAGILREAMQEVEGIKHPHLHAPLEEHEKISMAKHEDKLWYMFTVAIELNDLEIFTEYKFLDELRKMGHNESLELFIRQERPQ
jgi:hypothetical protein